MLKDSTETRKFKKKYTKELKIGIVQARFNQEITDYISQTCIAELIRLGVNKKNIKHLVVPGAIEIPFALQALIDNAQYDALIAVGCVIRGETYHFELVSNQSAAGISKVSLDYAVPVINSVITTENQQQASDRQQSKGFSSAYDAIEMALLAKEIYRI